MRRLSAITLSQAARTAMVEKVITSSRNVVSFARYQAGRNAAGKAMSARICRHCGAALVEGGSEEVCSSAFNIGACGLRGVPRTVYADCEAGVLRAKGPVATGPPAAVTRPQ